MMRKAVFLLLFAGLLGGVGPVSAAFEVEWVTDNAGRVELAPDGEIWFDRRSPDGNYQLWRRRGADEFCVSCRYPRLGAGHVGNPAVHGDQVLFQALNTTLAVKPVILKLGFEQHSSPGGAINNELWLYEQGHARVRKLWGVAGGGAVLHPQWGESGKAVVWAEKLETRARGKREAWGEWGVRIARWDPAAARFVGAPQLLKPGGLQFYETHALAHGDLYFSGFRFDDESKTLDIYRYSVRSGELTNLSASPREWDEFVQPSPDGQWLAWVSSRGTPQPRNRNGDIRKGKFLLELWVMRADGSGARGVSGFNHPGTPEYDARGVVVADFSWGPDSRSVLAKVRVQQEDIMSGESLRWLRW